MHPAGSGRDSGGSIPSQGRGTSSLPTGGLLLEQRARGAPDRYQLNAWRDPSNNCWLHGVSFVRREHHAPKRWERCSQSGTNHTGKGAGGRPATCRETHQGSPIRCWISPAAPTFDVGPRTRVLQEARRCDISKSALIFSRSPLEFNPKARPHVPRNTVRTAPDDD